MEYSELQQKFHAMMGTWLAAKIFAEYSLIYRSFIDMKVKGQTTIHNRTLEAENRACLVVDLLGVELKKIGCDLDIAEEQMIELETTIHSHLQLNEINQKRVMGLINKLKKEQENAS